MRALQAGSHDKHKLAAILSLSFTMSFTVLLFTPLDLYLHNPMDFVVSWKFLLPPLLITSVICAAAMAFVLWLLWRGKLVHGIALFLTAGLTVMFIRITTGKLVTLSAYIFPIVAASMLLWVLLIKACRQSALDIALLTLSGMMVSVYVQILFLNGEMTMITGDQAGYGALTAGHFVNLLIGLILTFLPLSLYLYFRARKRTFKYEKAVIFAMLLIAAMQTAGLVSTAVTTDLPAGYDEGEIKYFSYESALHYSREDNIIVFVLDRMDGRYMTEVLEAYPELHDQLDGFTFYRNNVSEFGNTLPSIPVMLTQHYYDFDRELLFSDYFVEAWSQHTLVDALKENGFITNLYLDNRSTYGRMEQLRGKADNLKDAVRLAYNVRGLLNVSVRMSLGRSLPYVIKNFFLAPISFSFSNEFFVLTASDQSEIADLTVGSLSDIAFYHYIKDKEFAADSPKRIFTFIHMNCAHVDTDKAITTRGYHYNETSEDIEWLGNYVDTSRACFAILNTYFNKLKHLGVYDNSTIFLIADHGLGPMSTSTLLIKPKGSAGKLSIDDVTRLSNKYFGASILKTAAVPHEHLGETYFDIISNHPSLPQRIVYVDSHWWTARKVGINSIFLRGVYVVPEDANDFEHWEFIENTR